MRRLHRNQAARARMEEMGLPIELVDANGDGIVTDEELDAAIERIDENKDGVIGQDELKKSLLLLGRIASELGIE